MIVKEFTTEELQDYFSGKKKHEAYLQTVELADAMRIHSDGIYPQTLIDERRPSESEAVREYRKLIWKPISKTEFGKVMAVLNKIRRSAEWSIKFDETAEAVKRIPEGETLADYFENKFPRFGNLTTWLFEVLLRAYCVDANAVVAVMPMQEETAPDQFVKPYPFIFFSDQVIDFAEGEYAVLKSRSKTTFTENKTVKQGDIYYVLNTVKVERYDQISSDGEYQLAWEYVHNMQLLPVVKTKGVLLEEKNDTLLYESKLSAMLPRLDEAVREYSDLQAEVVQHIFSEKWEYTQEECTACKGRGGHQEKIDDRYQICDQCKGTGAKQRGPYTTLLIKAPMAGLEPSNVPMPPIGYVQKQIDIAKLQDERIDKHIYKAFSAVNMEFLAETPMNQSGLAKAVDRDELDTFLHSIGEGLVNVADSVVYFSNEYRNAFLVPDLEQRIELLPIISVPEKFDVLSTRFLEEELKSARENNLNPAILNALEIEYANKKFSADPKVRDTVTLGLLLDPLAGASEEDKMIRLSNGGITKESYIISCNVYDFISRAVDDIGDKFFTLDRKAQKELMRKYAQEQATEAVRAVLGPLE